MAKITPIRITEQFEHFLKELKESFWGDLYGETRLAWKKFWEAQSAARIDDRPGACRNSNHWQIEQPWEHWREQRNQGWRPTPNDSAPRSV